jgi:hypothetical protein
MIHPVLEDADKLRQINHRAREDNAALPAPVGTATIHQAESTLGFSLPPLLAAVYQEIADGSFGPDYGLLPLLTGARPSAETIVGSYLGRRTGLGPLGWPWPEGVAPVLHWAAPYTPAWTAEARQGRYCCSSSTPANWTWPGTSTPRV